MAAATRLALACLIAGGALMPPGSLAAQSPDSAIVGDAPQQLVTAFHVHSQASSGTQTLAQLADLAQQAGVDALVLTENLGYEFRYAPAFLRFFFEARASTPTLDAYGVGRYLAELEEAGKRSPGVMLIPGVEVPPYYYWTGSLLAGNLVLNDMQRNVLVLPSFGEDTPVTAAQAFLEGLPAVGNRHHRHYGAGSFPLLLPGLFLVAVSLYRLSHGPVLPRRPRAWFLLAVLVSGIGLLWINFPFSVPSLAPYDAVAGHGPVQRLFDYVRDNEGLAFWSMPEAVDYREHAVGPLSVQLSTAPYAEALGGTDRYTGFGGVYADTVALWEPGHEWDLALRDFQAQKRETAPWVVGESAYHYPGQAGKQLDDVLTVLLVDAQTPEAALAALSGGHGYSLRRQQGGADLRLSEFALVTGGGGRIGRMGDTLELNGTGAFEVVMRVDDGAGNSSAVEIEVIRNGTLHRRFDSVTPFNERWDESLEDDEDLAYYRVIVRGARPAYLVSNPIFVRRDAGAGGAANPAGSR